MAPSLEEPPAVDLSAPPKAVPNLVAPEPEHCPGPESEKAGQGDACAGCPNQQICASAPKGPDPDIPIITDRLSGIRHKILVLSGKGGVGKSSVTTQLALTLTLQGHKVGVLDVDLTGPSIPRFFNIESSKVTQAPGGWIPVPVPGPTPSSPEQQQGTLTTISLGFLLSSRSSAVIWRGPKKTAMVRQFLSDVHWGSLDYLLIDTPPGTSDEHISLVETLLKLATPEQLRGAVIVTTPQAISVSDVKKEINFCRKTGVKVLGVVENMAGFVCPNCSECTYVFSKGGGEVMAREFGVEFLGSVPIDPMFVRLIEEGLRPTYPEGTERGEGVVQVREGETLLDKYTHCSLYWLFDGIVRKLTGEVAAT